VFRKKRERLVEGELPASSRSPCWCAAFGRITRGIHCARRARRRRARRAARGR
jgi:hypothetical protein